MINPQALTKMVINATHWYGIVESNATVALSVFKNGHMSAHPTERSFSGKENSPHPHTTTYHNALYAKEGRPQGCPKPWFDVN